jgi:hypothetical protein
MPIAIGEVTSDVRVEDGDGAPASAAECAPLPEAAELLRWSLAAESATRARRRLACIDEDD